MPISGDCVVVARNGEGQTEAGYLDDDSSEYCYDDQEQQVDLAQALFDEVMTAMPMKPLCSEQCPGVRAGERESSAGNDEVDPRWEALRKLGKGRTGA